MSTTTIINEVGIEIQVERSERQPSFFIGAQAHRRAGWGLDGTIEVTFSAYNEDHRVLTELQVKWPEIRSWHPKGAEIISRRLPATVDAALGQVISETWELASTWAEAIEVGFQEQLEAERQRREEREEKWRQERVERQKALAARAQVRAEVSKARQEELQWMLHQKMRLRRHGMRATVFGKLDDVSASRANLTTEKGKEMRLGLLEIEHFEVKYEGDRAYTEVELTPLPPEPAVAHDLRRYTPASMHPTERNVL